MIRIRDATLDDADAIALVHVRTWQEGYRGIVSDAALATLDVAARALKWRDILAGAKPGTLVADDDGARGVSGGHGVERVGVGVVGFASFGKARDADIASEDELYAIYVSSTHWSAGVGHALVSEVERRLHGRAALWVLADNPRARTFYERHGWRVDGVERVVNNSAASGLVEVRYRKELAP